MNWGICQFVMNEKVYNYLGDDISDLRILLLDDSYGYIDDNNIPHINWGNETEICDKDGFDKEYRPINGSAEYIIKDYIIPKGTMICRYGFLGGLFTTIKGAEYEYLGLPYVKESIEYHEFKVSEDLSVDCRVIKGKVAPKFNSEGGAVQFMHKQPVRLKCEDGYLQEDISWRQQII